MMINNNQTFHWTGINKQGKRVSGFIKAADTKDAQVELSKSGIEIITLNVKNAMSVPGLNIFSGRKKVKKRDILIFTRHLSTMLFAGLPLIQALDVIGNDKDNPPLKILIDSIRASITEGKTFSESLGNHPQYFNSLYCNLIKAGEKSGTLSTILVRIGNYLERTENLKRKIKKALVYPAAILTIAAIV